MEETIITAGVFLSIVEGVIIKTLDVTEVDQRVDSNRIMEMTNIIKTGAEPPLKQAQTYQYSLLLPLEYCIS